MPTAADLESVLVRHVVEPWFPRCLDREHGGFLCDFDRKWQPAGPQDKFLEFQARQTWLAALASRRYPQDEGLREALRHGLLYLSDAMWDSQHGGWFQRLDRTGAPLEEGVKHAHGGSYAIAACAEASVTLNDPSALELARTGLDWLGAHAWDREHGGYFGFMSRDGSLILDPTGHPTSSDTIGTPIGLKDANVNSDFLETLNVLVAIDPAETHRARLAELLLIVCDRMTSADGELAFFCEPDWTRRSGIRFGTQLQTVHRLVTAGELLGVPETDDGVAVRLFRRAIELGWDGGRRGFPYAQSDDYRPQRREWWVPMECLRTLAALGPLADEGPGRRALEEGVWAYVRDNLLDETYRGMYQESLDGLSLPRRALGIRFAPDFVDLKGCIWKDGWHEGKALLVCMAAASGEPNGADGA